MILNTTASSSKISRTWRLDGRLLQLEQVFLFSMMYPSCRSFDRQRLPNPSLCARLPPHGWLFAPTSPIFPVPHCKSHLTWATTWSSPGPSSSQGAHCPRGSARAAPVLTLCSRQLLFWQQLEAVT